jgi:hypothetical protein
MRAKVKGVFITPQRTAGRIRFSFPHNVTEYGGPTGPHCPQPLPPGVGTNYLELIALRSQLIGIAMEVYTWNCNSSELQPK